MAKKTCGKKESQLTLYIAEKFRYSLHIKNKKCQIVTLQMHKLPLYTFSVF